MHRPSCFLILLFPELLDLREIRSVNSGPAEADNRVFSFSLVSAERGCNPDCSVFCNISENVRKLKWRGIKTG